MKRIYYIFISSLLLVLLSCQNNSGSVQQSYTSGFEQILVDESFAPIIEDQEYLFESTYPDAKLDLLLKSENELL